MDDAESARRRGGNNEEYHRYSPLGIFSDSYFTHPLPYNEEQNVNSAQAGSIGFGMDIDSQGATNYAGYQSYQRQVPTSMDLDVLSAESYHEGPYSRGIPSPRVSGSTQMYGGLLVDKPSDVKAPSPPAGMKTRRSTKKDASKSASADETVTRQRGRPRLDNRDQTAAERRRTQIRLAQRAYRQRKETTISRLNRRVTSLERTIEDMNKAFLDFNEKAIAAGIQKGAPPLAKQLELTAERISELAKNSKHESDNEEEENEPNLSAQTVEIGQERAPNSRRTAAGSGTIPASMLGNQTTFEEEPEDYDGEIAHQNPAPPAQLEQFPLSDWTATEVMQQYRNNFPQPTVTTEDESQSMQQYRVEIPETTVFAQDSLSFDLMTLPGDLNSSVGKRSLELMSLPMPTSHSYQETSFARRLMRSTVEANIRLMTNPNSRPEDLKRLCKFTWCFAKSSDMIEHMMTMAQKTVRDGIENWEAPRLHLGGAGLHYPREGVDGETPAPAWWANEAPMGPRRSTQPETPMPDDMAIAEIIQRVQVAGDWFDSSDVEQYLQRKGLYLDGQSSIVEITEPDETVPELQETQIPSVSSLEVSSPKDSSRGPLSPQGIDTSWFNDPFVSGTDYGWTEDMPVPDVNMNFSFGNVDYSFPKDVDPSFDFSQYPETMPTFNTKMKKFLDVEKFLNTMSQESTCIGRTAGFRKATIDSALTSATIEQF